MSRFFLLCIATSVLSSPVFSNREEQNFAKDAQKVFLTPESLHPSIVVDLRNPTFSDGVLTTNEGGVIKSKEIRIQAKNIRYINKNQLQQVQASEDVMIRYENRIFIGEKMFYDFKKKEGVIYLGKTYHAPWYIGGGKITLKDDGSYEACDVDFTTCESKEAAWQFYAKKVKVKEKKIDANGLRFAMLDFFKLWLPSYRVNMNKTKTKPIFRYSLDWDRSTGPKGSIRYQALSWRDFLLFLRFDYRYSLGPGGAIETEYFPTDSKTSLVTKNYIAKKDILPNDPNERFRYRVQGEYHTKTADNRTKVDLTWDKYSDINMPGDFKSPDFEINTAKRTELNIRRRQDPLLCRFHARVRANSFETIKEDLPTFFATMQPKDLPLGLITNNWVKTSYLEYAYSDKLSPSLPDLHSIRLQNYHELYRPFHLGPIIATPKVGATGVFYNESPAPNHSTALGSIFYSGLITTRFYKHYNKNKHIVEPYLLFEGQTEPTKSTSEHLVFSIQDGFHRLNQFKLGIKNQLYSPGKCDKPLFFSDLYLNAFTGDRAMSSFIPKAYLTLGWNLSSVYLWSYNSWNIHRNTLDFSNTRLGWTINENFAFTMEFRHRSRYDWRKSDHQNFILDVARSESSLLRSPLSDKRNTLLTNFFLRINPYWSALVESHLGWDRTKESFYNEFKIDLYRTISTSWRASITFLHTQTDDRFSAASISLVKVK